MRNFAFAVAALGLVAAAQPANALVNLVANGDFEGGTKAPLADGSKQPVGWTYTTGGPINSNATVIAYGQAGQYPTGAFGEAVPGVTTSTSVLLATPGSAQNPFVTATNGNGLYLSTDTGTNTISQSVAISSLGTYSFGFNFYLPANGYGNPNGATFVATIGNQALTFVASNYAPQQWYSYTGTTTVTALTNNFNLSFAGNGVTAKDFVIDNVFLVQGTVPEPITWAMMVGGFGLMGATMRRRRVSTTFA